MITYGSNMNKHENYRCEHNLDCKNCHHYPCMHIDKVVKKDKTNEN